MTGKKSFGSQVRQKTPSAEAHIVGFRIAICPLRGWRSGGLAEWSNAPVLKTGGRESVPRVRIPEPPPIHIFRHFRLLAIRPLFALF